MCPGQVLSLLSLLFPICLTERRLLCRTAIRVKRAGGCTGLGCSRMLRTCSSLPPSAPPPQYPQHPPCARSEHRGTGAGSPLSEITNQAAVFTNKFHHNPRYEGTLYITFQFLSLSLSLTHTDTHTRTNETKVSQQYI